MRGSELQALLFSADNQQEVFMPSESAIEIMDELIEELATTSGPCERVIEEYTGSMVVDLSNPAPRKNIHARADMIVEELRKSWGPTADPHWADDIIQDRGSEGEGVFALFHRKGVWGYVRFHFREAEIPDHGCLSLILGVAKDLVWSSQ
jgi:hypothetical protein